MPEHVRITDVSPRDGLQNEPGVIPTADKVRLIELLTLTGVDEIEITSFVSPRWVPQLSDAAEVCRALANTSAGSLYSALVPNERGFEGVLEANRTAGRRLIGKVAVFTAASEEFSRRNVNASIAETLDRFAPVIAGARREGLAVRAYISCVIACPFEGPITPHKVSAVAEQLRNLGVDELDLGDTIGAGTPESVRTLLKEVRKVWTIDGSPAYTETAPHPFSPATRRGLLTLHLHDTFGRAADCVRAALDEGVRSFDGAAGGLGGCPYAGSRGKPAPGNISSETLVRTVEAAGYRTSVNHERLAEAGAFARSLVAQARGQALP